MSEQPEYNSEGQLENLLAILTNTNDSPTKSKAEDLSTKISNDKSSQSNQSDIDNLSSSARLNLKKKEQEPDNNVEQEFEVLQKLFGKSEIDKLKDRVSNLEVKSEKLTKEKEELAKKYYQLKSKFEQQSQLINDQSKAFAQVLNQSLGQFKQDLLIEIAIMLEKFVEDNIHQEQNFSIKVTGLSDNVKL